MPFKLSNRSGRPCQQNTPTHTYCFIALPAALQLSTISVHVARSSTLPVMVYDFQHK